MSTIRELVAIIEHLSGIDLAILGPHFTGLDVAWFIKFINAITGVD